MPDIPEGEDPRDLDAAVATLLRAVDGVAPDPLVAADLADALAVRYELRWDDDDRDEAIRWFRTAHDLLRRDTDRDLLVNLPRLAELLLDRGQETDSADDLAAAIGYAERALELPGDGYVRDRVRMLYVLGQSRLARAGLGTADPRPELTLAARHLREARALPPVPYPEPGDLTATLGLVLSSWAGADVHLGFGTAAPDEARERADEAIRLLTDGRDALRPEDPLRAWVWLQLGKTLAIRPLVGGDAGDHTAALAEFEALLDSPGVDPAIADTCRHYIAVLLLTGWMPGGWWSALSAYDHSVHERMFRNTEDGPSPEDARRALDHLERISADSDAVSRADVRCLRAYATIYQRPGGPADEDIDQAIRDAEAAVQASRGDDSDHGVLTGILGHLMSVRAERSGSADDRERALENFARAAEEADPDHPLRPMLLGSIGEALDMGEPAEQGSAERREAAVMLLERVLRQMPDDHPSRVQTLTHIGRVLLRQTRFDHSPERFDRVRELLYEAVERPAAGPENEAVNHLLLAKVDMVQANAAGDTHRLDGVAERLRHAAGLVPESHGIRATILYALCVLYSLRYHTEGGLEFLDAADHYAEMVLQAARDNGDSSSEEVLFCETHLAESPLERNRWGLTGAELDDVIGRLEALSGRTDVASELAMARLLRSIAGSDPRTGAGQVRIDHARLAEIAAALASQSEENELDDTGYPLLLALRGQLQAAQGYLARDLDTLDAGLRTIGDAYAMVETLPPARRWEPAVVGVLTLLGAGLVTRHRLSGDRADLSRGIDRIEAARVAVSEFDIDHTTVHVTGTLAHAYHLRDDRALKDRHRAVRLGLEVLAERGTTVLLQSSTSRAFESASAVAAEALEVARWALGEGLTEAAVEVLERGRAMVLHAATAEAAVPELLRRAGRDDLATEWEAAPSATADPAPWNLGAADPPSAADVLARLPVAQDPSDLRHRVLAALEGTDMRRSLLAPPSVPEIAETLREAAVDAMVYLLPRDQHGPGIAVVVDAGGRVREIPLPRLAADERSRVGAFAAAQRDRVTAEPGTPEADRIHHRWTYALGDLCDWAWEAAMEELLAAMPGRLPRLVLVPVGELGLVPWHAARRAVGNGRRRYACQDAVISYAGSARQYVDARGRGRLPWGDAPALVRVGDGALYWASKEIEELHQRHYRHGALYGGRKRGGRRSPEATKENVRNLLPGPGSAGASLLHLGCHAHPAPRPVDSSLALPRGERLSMSEVLERARARPSGSPGGLVILAACGSDLTAADHDEALTLAAAFLAAGASGAVGARWPVDDVPTALFMMAFHHYLNSGYDEPARALRAAQIWMLDPVRRLPTGAGPKPAGEPAPAGLAEPAAWAAFTYQGW